MEFKSDDKIICYDCLKESSAYHYLKNKNKSDLHYCSICEKCNGHTFCIDSSILESFIELRKKKYIVLFTCSGHISSAFPYISIRGSLDNIPTPKGFTKEDANYKGFKRVLFRGSRFSVSSLIKIRLTMNSRNFIDKFLHKMIKKLISKKVLIQKNKDLLAWAKNLPENKENPNDYIIDDNYFISDESLKSKVLIGKQRSLNYLKKYNDIKYINSIKEIDELESIYRDSVAININDIDIYKINFKKLNSLFNHIYLIVKLKDEFENNPMVFRTSFKKGMTRKIENINLQFKIKCYVPFDEELIIYEF